MPKDDLSAFMSEVAAESKAAGPAAVAASEAYRQHFQVARAVLESRRAKGWTQQRLARLSGVQQSEISRIEAGRGNPTFHTLARLAQSLGLEVVLVPRASVTGRQPRARASSRRLPVKRRKSPSAPHRHDSL